MVDATGTGSTTGSVWAAGATVTLDVTGGTDVGAFQSQLVQPAAATITSPVFKTDTNIDDVTVDRSQALVLTWTPTDESMLVEVYQRKSSLSNGWDGVSIQCTFAGSAGTGTIPSAVLTEYLVVDQTPKQLMDGLAFHHAKIVDKAVGGVTVRLFATNYQEMFVQVK
jgi:hypothetical protein